MVRFFCKGIGVVARAESRKGEKVGRAEDLMLARIRDEHPHMIGGLTLVQHE